MADIINQIVDNVFLDRAGTVLIFIIRRRTKKGWFLPGSSRGANRYSTKPFAMPVGAASKTLGSKLIKSGSSKRSKLFDPDNFHIFTSKQGNLWVIVKKGYKKVRQLAGLPSDRVTMSWSSRYMSDIAVLKKRNNSLEIGWKSAENKKLASFHEQMGAGRSKRLHKILGLLKKEEEEMGAYIEAELMKKLDKAWK